MPFKLKDDLFDYGKEDVGKPTGNDIKEKKMTLPLIYTLNNCDKATKSKIINIFKNANKKKNEISFIIETVINHRGIKYAEEKMDEYIRDAFEILNQFPDNEAKQYLIKLVNYTTERKY